MEFKAQARLSKSSAITDSCPYFAAADYMVAETTFDGGCRSEADNLAIKGVAEAYGDKGNHIITSQIEHPAVLNTCRYLERHGYEVTYLRVDEYGLVDSALVEEAIRERTILISVMHANNEVGTVEPIAAIGAIANAKGILFHTDAAQSVGKIPTKVDKLGVDLLTIAGHKLYAPKGVGALYVRAGTKLESLIHGAGHESGRRAGTENVSHIVALGKACEVAALTMPENTPRMRMLRDRLHQRLAVEIEGMTLNGHPADRLPNTLNVSFPGIDGESLLARIHEVAASTGSACHAGRTEPQRYCSQWACRETRRWELFASVWVSSRPRRKSIMQRLL